MSSRLYNVPFEPRAEGITTHRSIVDDHIYTITSWRINEEKYKKIKTFYYLSFGIVYIVLKINPNYIISLYCDPAPVDRANYFQISDYNGSLHVVEAVHESFLSPNDKLIKIGSMPTIKLNDENVLLNKLKETNFINDNLITTFTFNKLRYFYTEDTFQAIQFTLSGWTIKEIVNTFLCNDFTAPSLEEHNYLLNKYGTNEIYTQSESFFLKHLLNWQNAFSLFAVILWIIEGYYSYAIVILLCYLIMIALFTLYSYRSLKFDQECNAHYDESSSIDQPWAIVPGIIRKVSSDTKIDFDALILQGYCTADESELTGETSEIYKMQLNTEKDGLFSYSYTNQLLFRGSTIKKCLNENGKEQKLTVLVLNTGMNTQRGNLLLNLEFPKKTNFSEYINIKLFVYLMCLVCFSTGLALIISKKDTIVFFDSLTVIFPPMLFVALNASLYYYQHLLYKEGINCSDARKIKAAACADIIVFDKTGTLTKDEFELFGFQFTIPAQSNDTIGFIENSDTVTLSKIEKSPKVMNKMHQLFWRNYDNIKNTNYKDDPTYGMIYFTECLGCCHGIDKFDNRFLGDSIDLQIFSLVNWTIQIKEEHDRTERYLFPSHLCKITEKKLFQQLQDNFASQTKEELKNQYKLLIIKHYGFSSETQSDSVVIKNCLDDTYRLFTKGAPETILDHCSEESKPIDINNAITELTTNGFRIIACATKQIKDTNYYINNYSLETEEGLTFLGFVIFRNPLKEDTKTVIQTLFNANYKLRMSTGDNEETSFRVAQDAGMIPQIVTNHYSIDFSLKSFGNIIIKDHNAELRNITIEEIMKFNKPFISVSGPALALILNKHKLKESVHTDRGGVESKDLLEFIREYGVIYYRMKPKNKADLIEFLKSDNKSIVVMCGDSSNDIPAIKEADIGIVIAQENNMDTQSHFFMKDSSIKCVETIIKTGRACHHYTFVLTQSMLMYALLRLTSTLCLQFLPTPLNFTHQQYFYMDCFCMMIPSLMNAWTDPGKVISRQKMPVSLLKPKVLISLSGQFAIFIGSLIGFHCYLQVNVNYANDICDVNRNNPCIYNSYMFLMNAFLILMCNLVLNISTQHREKFYTNICFIGSEIIMMFITLLFTSLSDFKDNKLVKNIVVFEKDDIRYEHAMEFNKFIYQIFLGGIALTSVTYQWVLDLTIRD